MRRALVVIATALPLLLAACGDEEDENGTTTTGAETLTESTTGAPASGEGPEGELTERGIGAVEVGMTTAEVEGAFGAPDREREVPGCPLAGPDAPPILQWTWNLADGNLILDFEVAGEELISYRTTASDLATTTGARVGDPFQELRQAYGAQLKPLALGAPPTESLGFWHVGNPAKRWQLFDIRGGAVKNIQGGDIQICE